MKLKPLFLMLCLLAIASCSSDDDSSGPSEPVVGNYFPSAENDTWIYSVENTSSTNSELDFTATDIVTIDEVNGNSYSIEVNNGTSLPNGTMNSILSSGTLTRSDSTLEFEGELGLLDILGIFSDFEIELNNFVVYDLNAGNNDELASVSDSFTQDFDADGTTLPISVSYTITNTKKSNLSSLEVDGETFNSVIRTEITMNLSIDATVEILGNPSIQPLLDAQDVLTINNYFAEDIGLIKSDTNQSYALNESLLSVLELAGIELGFATTSSVDNIQEIDSYILSGN